MVGLVALGLAGMALALGLAVMVGLVASGLAVMARPYNHCQIGKFGSDQCCSELR